MSKQDRQGVRTASGLEQKYGFGTAFANLNMTDKKQGSAFSQYVKSNNATLTKMQKEQNEFSEETSKSFEETSKSFEEISKTIKMLETKLSKYWETVYPVGSVYVSVSSTSPQTLFGGTWERLKDRFLLAAGDTYAAGNTGGEATHKLTEEQLPAIDGKFATPVVVNHALCGVSGNAYGYNFGVIGSGNAYGITDGITGNKVTNGTQYGYGFKFGSGAAHNNMPPYLAVYVWKRTA